VLRLRNVPRFALRTELAALLTGALSRGRGSPQRCAS
jgi:hypothetical protein